jgi:hypothetical protein
MLLSMYAKGDIPRMVRTLRWVLGGGALALAALLGVTGRIGIASILALVGSSILSRGRLGPIDFNTTQPVKGRKSRVRSTYFDMQLDHDTGGVSGKSIFGKFSGRELMSIGEDEMRDMLKEVSGDPDSLSLLEAWLDVNRAGWREYFGQEPENDTARASSSSPMDRDQAYEILGLHPGATEAEIKVAHHRLLKAVHPDQGGSNFLAARVNAAKDFLLD